jgi:manganese/zinc/iron transport system ATP- binding protein
MTPPVALAALDGAAPADAPLVARGVTVGYGATIAVLSLNAEFPAGAMTAIVGPNGAGKSSFLKAAVGATPRIAGDVRFFGQSFEKARARVAYVPQRAAVDWDFPARALDVVLMGLWPKLGLFRWVGRRERAAAMAALDRMGMAGFADRQIGRLSGGQQQRVFLARALAQDADLYLLDEPFAGIDAATEAAIVTLLRQLRDEGRAVVCVHHDLSTASDYFDRALVMNGRRIAEGPVKQVLTDQVLRAAYGGRLPTAA